MEQKKNILISFSFGESSAYMTIKLWEKFKNRNDVNVLICFANTGKEREQTLVFGKRVQDTYGIPVFWLEPYISPHKGTGVWPVVVDFETADRTDLIEMAKEEVPADLFSDFGGQCFCS